MTASRSKASAMHALGAGILGVAALAGAGSTLAQEGPQRVNVDNFARAETDLYFARAVKGGAFGQLVHAREPASIENQAVVRMNRDTLYSSGVFDLQAGPVTLTLPNVGSRFMSLQVINEDHFTTEVVYGPGAFTYDRAKVGTRYVLLLVRTLVDPQQRADVDAAHQAQGAIRVEQAAVGRFEVPQWDQPSQDKLRNVLKELAVFGSQGVMFGSKAEVNPVSHLIGSAMGWGGNPPSAAVYAGAYPARNDGRTIHRLKVKDVPVDGFWSVTVYNAKGYFEKNELGAYSLNNLTAKPDADGSITIQFGGCERATPNCLPVMAGWNYTVRMYRPRQSIIDGSWKFPEAMPVAAQ